jgi:hypothetical protein
LNAGGYAAIWFQSGLEYTIKVASSGGINCSSGSTQYTVNHVNTSLLNLQNTWQQPQIFDLPIQILAPDLQIVFGSASGNQTTLDIPPVSSNTLLHGPTLIGNDTLVSQNSVQPLTNKNLVKPQINGCGMFNSPATYFCLASSSSSTTVLHELAVFTGAPSTLTAAPAGTQIGIQGVVVDGAGVGTLTTVQQNGQTTCMFDNSTTAGDYVVPSLTSDGECSDDNLAPPSPFPQNVQVVGQVMSSGGPGLHSILLSGSAGFVTPNGTPTVTAYPGSGTGATISLLSGSTDLYGLVTLNTGTSPVLDGVIFTLNFSVGGQKFCTWFPSSFATAGASNFVYADSSSIAIDFNNITTALTGSTNYAWSYTCN